MLVDSHAHIYEDYYDDIPRVINDAKSHGVSIIISDGVDRKTNEEMLVLSKKYENIYITLGVHPENVDSFSEKDILFIKNNLDNEKVVAIGEIGLDYHYEGYDKDKQIKVFEEQLALAEKYHMPVVIHSREATEDTLRSVKKYKVTGVIHSFSGSAEIAREYIKMGFLLGINGVVTFRNANIKKVIGSIGINSFILETDCPYLTPEPYRGARNNPSNIVTIANYLSEYLGIPFEDIAVATTNNVLSLFDKIKR